MQKSERKGYKIRKERFMKQLGKYIKVMISVLSIVNLIALFQFEYQIPKIPRLPFLPQEEEDIEETSTEQAEEPTWEFQFETDTLVYDGTTELNLLEGVTLVNEEGKVSDAEIFVRMTTAENLSSKVIEYSADTENGRVTGTRNLQLVNY